MDYYTLPGKVRQLDAYNAALHCYRKQYKYMAFLDCDEFLYGENDLYDTIDGLFRDRQHMGGLGVNWLSFGSSGHRARPEGGVVENYLWRAEDDFSVNHQLKTVVIPTRAFAFVSPHYPVYRRGFKGYDEKGRELDDFLTETVSTENIRINHYFTKSQDDWIEKVNKGRADIHAFREMKEFDFRDRNEVFDDRLLRRIKALKSKNGIGGNT